jgi:prepilin signal peptidase PulO-like enzyme (type II secretory pathway)
MDLLFLQQIDGGFRIAFLLLIAFSMGSFASLVSWRLANSQSIFTARSKCPNCHHNLKLKSLIPIFSYLIQKGKCSICAAKISIRYPAIEISFGLIFLIIYFAGSQKIDQKMLLIMAISTVMIIMIITDLEHYFIPNSLQYSLVILATILNISLIGTSQTIYSFYPAFAYASFALSLYFIFLFLVKKEAIGIDDIKFFFIAGFMLGFNKFFTFLLLTGLIGTIFGSLWIKFKKDEIFPFAPALCVATFLCLLFDKKVNPLNLLSKKLGNLLF